MCVGSRIQIDCMAAKVACMHHLLSFARCTMPCVSTSSCSVYVPPLGTDLWFAQHSKYKWDMCFAAEVSVYYFLNDSAIIHHRKSLELACLTLFQSMLATPSHKVEFPRSQFHWWRGPNGTGSYLPVTLL